MTSEKQPPVYSGHYFGALKVVVVQRFDCIYNNLPQNPKVMPVVDRWSLFRGAIKMENGTPRSAIQRWLLDRSGLTVFKKISWLGLAFQMFASCVTKLFLDLAL